MFTMTKSSLQLLSLIGGYCTLWANEIVSFENQLLQQQSGSRLEFDTTHITECILNFYGGYQHTSTGACNETIGKPSLTVGSRILGQKEKIIKIITYSTIKIIYFLSKIYVSTLSFAIHCQSILPNNTSILVVLGHFAPFPVRPGSFRPYSRSPSFINSVLKNEIWKIPLQIFV